MISFMTAGCITWRNSIISTRAVNLTTFLNIHTFIVFIFIKARKLPAGLDLEYLLVV